jgi:hypothetical protein
MMAPLRSQEERFDDVPSQALDCYTASRRCTLAEVVVAGCSLVVPECILVSRLPVASVVDPVVVTEGLGAVAGAVGSQFDCTRPDRIQPAEGILPGSPEKKRRMKQPAEALALQEGLRALGIAI